MSTSNCVMVCCYNCVTSIYNCCKYYIYERYRIRSNVELGQNLLVRMNNEESFI